MPEKRLQRTRAAYTESNPIALANAFRVLGAPHREHDWIAEAHRYVELVEADNRANASASHQ